MIVCDVCSSRNYGLTRVSKLCDGTEVNIDLCDFHFKEYLECEKLAHSIFRSVDRSQVSNERCQDWINRMLPTTSEKT